MSRFVLAAALLASASTVSAQEAPDFSGAYVGLSFGSAATSLTVGSDTLGIDFTGPQVSAGYLLPLGDFLVGGELSVEDSTLKAAANGQSIGVDVEGRTTLVGLKVGRAFGDWMPFGMIRFGNVNVDGDADLDVRELRLGTEYAIQDNWFATGSIGRVEYSFEENGEDFSFDGKGVSVGVLYRF